jgi:hypothetical protein
MGAWSPEPFGNDTACDWGWTVLETTDLSAIEAALDAVLDNGDEYLDSDLASEAIAAIEIIAKLMGKGTQTDGYTQDIDQWVASHPLVPSASLLEKACAGIDRIQSKDSELLELWQESGSQAWKASLAELRAAVSA